MGAYEKGEVPSTKAFQVASKGRWSISSVARINDNAYKLDLPSEYNVSATFNVSDLSPFDVGEDSRMNPFEEGE